MSNDQDGAFITVRQVARSGISFGTALAICISWTTHKSLLWAILHGVFGWFYVGYFAVMRV